MALVVEKFQTFLEETPIPCKVGLVTRAGYVPLVAWNSTLYIRIDMGHIRNGAIR